VVSHKAVSKEEESPPPETKADDHMPKTFSDFKGRDLASHSQSFTWQ